MSISQTMSDAMAMSSSHVMANNMGDIVNSQAMMSDTQNMSTTTVDTASLSTKVRHYLKTNQIQWSRFSSLVLGVSQSRLSTLLSKPQPWHLLTRRVQALYQRMQLWMDTRATYGNNPYYKEKTVGQALGRKEKKSLITKKPRSLFEMKDNMELLKQLEYFTAAHGLLEESGGGSQAPGGLMVEQDDVAPGVIEDGEVTVDMQKYNQMVTDMDQMANQEEEEIMATGCVENQMGLEEGSVFIYQTEGREEDQSVCQLKVEDNPDQPGTFKVSIIQVTGAE